MELNFFGKPKDVVQVSQEPIPDAPKTDPIPKQPVMETADEEKEVEMETDTPPDNPGNPEPTTSQGIVPSHTLGAKLTDEDEVPASLVHCLENVLTDTEKVTLGERTLLMTFGGLSRAGDRFPEWFPHALHKAVVMVAEENRDDQATLQKHGVTLEDAPMQQLHKDMEVFDEFQTVLSRGKGKGKGKNQSTLSKSLAKVEEEARRKADDEAETAQQEVAATQQNLTQRQRREHYRNAMLMKAVKDIAMVGGMSEVEAAKSLKDLESQTPEERGAVLLSTIRTNANSGFKYFKPMCVSDCQKDPRNQAKPPAVYDDGMSDDEEWIKSDPLDTPVSEYYADALEAMRLSDVQYYTRLCKQKLLWAAKQWSSTRPCPFQICEQEDESRATPKTWATRVRYLRHLTEWHFHHHTRYDCILVEKARRSEGCKTGQRHTRRADLVKHMMSGHKIAMGTAAPRALKLHSKMWTEFLAGSRGIPSEEDFGDVGTGRVKGFFKYNDNRGRLHLEKGPMYDEFQKWNNKGKPPRPAPKRPATGDTQAAKKVRSNSTERPSVMERVKPPDGGPTFTSTKTDWRSGPQNVATASSIQLTSNDELGDDYEGEFPDPKLIPGEETQTLGKDLKPLPQRQRQPTAPSLETAPKRKPEVVRKEVTPPPDALVLEQRPPLFFRKADLQSFTIQQKAVNEWQDQFHVLVKQMAAGVSALSLTTITEIHHAEVKMQAEVARTTADESVRAAKQGAEAMMADAIEKKETAERSRQWYKKTLSDVREKHDDQDWKFKSCFGHPMEEWNGSRVQIDAWLAEMDSKEVSEKEEEEEDL